MLQHLTTNKLIKATASTLMDERYAAGLLHKTQTDAGAVKPSKEEIEYVARDVEVQTDGGKKEVKLLEAWNGSLLAEEFKLPELDIEIERAVWQVEQAMKKSEAEARASSDKDNEPGNVTRNNEKR